LKNLRFLDNARLDEFFYHTGLRRENCANIDQFDSNSIQE